MNKIVDYGKLEQGIVQWLSEYAKKAKVNGFVIGVSGGVDSGVVSTLAAKTGLPLTVLEMPIKQKIDQDILGKKHIDWLKTLYDNVKSYRVDLNANLDFKKSEFYSPHGKMSGEMSMEVNAFDILMKCLSSSFKDVNTKNSDLAEANLRSRFRMMMLYYYANINNCLVLGTGNKVEDFGIFFFTKGGDGMIDLSPIADLMKSEVRELGKYMGVINEIITAIPTDGLWDDNRSDEDAIGATYNELEWAMGYLETIKESGKEIILLPDISELTPRQIKIVEIYIKRNSAGKHKVEPIPIFDTQFLRS